MPPPTPPPFCSGYDEGDAEVAGDPAGGSSSLRPITRLYLRDERPTATAAVGHVNGRYRIAGVLQIYLEADYATSYPSEVPQAFSVTVRFERARYLSHPRSVGEDEGEEGLFAFERTLSASMVQPAFNSLGYERFEQSGVALEPGESMVMRLVDARWSLSPDRGREAVYTVHADVSRVSICKESFVLPSPPPSPPSLPPSPSPPPPRHLRRHRRHRQHRLRPHRPAHRPCPRRSARATCPSVIAAHTTQTQSTRALTVRP